MGIYLNSLAAYTLYKNESKKKPGITKKKKKKKRKKTKTKKLLNDAIE